MYCQSDLTRAMPVEQSSIAAEYKVLMPEGDQTKPGTSAPARPATAAPAVVTLDIPATLTHVHLLSRCACALVEGVANLAEPAANLYNLELALQEVAVNIVKHAYAQREGRIQMTLHLEMHPPRLTILLHDTGATFDPTLVPLPKLGELQEHGFGLFLMRQLLDEVEYSHNASGNVWKLVKTIPLVE